MYVEFNFGDFAVVENSDWSNVRIYFYSVNIDKQVLNDYLPIIYYTVLFLLCDPLTLPFTTKNFRFGQEFVKILK